MMRLACGTVLLAVLIAGCTGSRPVEPVEPAPVEAAEFVPQFAPQLGLLSCSGDGKRILRSVGKAVSLWDGDTGLQLRILPDLDDFVSCCCLSRDGTRAAAGTIGKAVIWDTQTGRTVATIERGGMVQEKVIAVALSADGKRLALASRSARLLPVPGWLEVYDVQTGRSVRNLGEQIDPVEHLALSDDGGFLASGGVKGAVKLWDTATGKVAAEFPQKGPLVDLALDGTAQRVLTLAFPNHAVLWEARTGKKLRTPDHLDDRLAAVALTRDGRRALLVGMEKKGALPRAILWDTANGKELRSVERGFGDAALSDDGCRAVLRSERVDTWDLEAGKVLAQLGTPVEEITATLSADGKRLITRARSGRWAVLWNPASGAGPRFVTIPIVYRDAFLTNDGTRLVSGHEDGLPSVQVVDVAIGKARFLAGYPGPVQAWSWDATQRRLLTAGQTAILWDLDTGKKLQAFATNGERLGMGGLNVVALSPDGKLAATATENRAITIWDARTGKEIRKLVSDGEVGSAAVFSGDGRVLGVAGSSSCAIWDVSTGKQVGTLPTGYTQGIALSEDGRVALAWSNIPTLWDTTTGKPLHQLRGHRHWVESVGLTPDGKRAVTASRDGTTRLWDVTTGKELAALVALPETKEWIIWTPDGRYDGSEKAGRFIAYRKPDTLDLSPTEALRKTKRVPGLLGQLLGDK